MINNIKDAIKKAEHTQTRISDYYLVPLEREELSELKNMLSFFEVVKNIEKWASDRNLIDGSTPAAQFEKLSEEFGELGRGLIENEVGDISDAIGDMFVVLTIIAKQHSMDIEQCIAYAYDDIKDRKGKMINGVFVKES